ncbi:MAG TPA: HAMP domain-containing sensor histidine kinase [Candidatus Paceibacterota bacterium]|nr:HAMP domain-containing sensor histidine kinase [Candidatus Paceibacterota bacterium]
MRTRVRTISYFLSIVAVAAIFFSVEFVTEKYFYPNDEVVDILAAIIGALSFAWCKRFFDRVTDRIFSRGPRDDRAEFLTNISHELQTPIAILRGNVEVLQRRSITDAERASAERVIVTTLDGMSRLIGNVLESAKLKFSKKIVHEDTILVGALLRETHEDCFLLAEDKGIRLSVEVATSEASKEDLSLRGNRDRLKEVLLNLISNALKHTARGGKVVLRAERAGTAARISVEDSGSGIAPEELPHIFERFYRIENGTAATPGTGLGLNICREIIEAHGGKITVESEWGKGSRFIICLPLSPPAGESAPLPASAIINS